MARKRIARLQDDPRWPDFIKRFAFDLNRFAFEVCGQNSTWQQIDLFNSVQDPGSRTSVVSGHGCFAMGTPIMLASGEVVPVEDILPGSQLMGPDGASSRTVRELARGRQRMYRFVYVDGTSHVFNESHVLCMIGPDGEKTTASVRQWLGWDPAKRASHECYRLARRAGKGAQARYSLLPIELVQPLGEGDYFGFTLDDDDPRFLGGDGTVLHNTGKSRSLGIIATWHLLCFLMSNTLITAPKIEQVQNVSWKEITDIKDHIQGGQYGWICDYYKVEDERVYVNGFKKQWFVIAKTAPRGQPENLAGMHRDWYLVIADEASGIPDANYGVLTGGLTDKRNRMLMTSQGTRNTGFFYDTHHKLSKSRGGPWNNLSFNSEESPLVSLEWILEKRNEYGGIDDPQYQIKVRGIFPENLVGQLLSRSALEKTIGQCCIALGEDFGWLVLVDVGAGEYRDKTVVIIAKVIGNGQPHEHDARRVHIVDVPICSNTISETTLIGELQQIMGRLSNATLAIDGGGIGGPLIKRLRDHHGLPHTIKILWGNPCFKKTLKEVFFNQRAQAMVTVARAAKAGQLSIDKHAFHDSRHQTELLDQGSRIPYHFNDKAQYVIESKRSKEWEGLPSPDIWDAISFAFLEEVHYIVSDAVDGERPPDARKATAERLHDEVEAALAAAGIDAIA